MAIYAIGAYHTTDVSQAFISQNLAGVGWSYAEAPELHEYMKSLKVADIIYIKSMPPSSSDIFVKGIGIIRDSEILHDRSPTSIARNVLWLYTEQFTIAKPAERNNVRQNTLYEEFHPLVQQEILRHLVSKQGVLA